MGRRLMPEWDEQDAYTGWRHVLARFSRAGVVARVKRRTHRRERREAKDAIRNRDS